jgi:hypothetical protein
VRYIAHRGLFSGPDKTLENRPEQILKALDLGFDVEVDVWYVDGEWFLGHDEPTYPISVTFLNHAYLWVHCKNIPALYELTELGYPCDFFWHQEDDCVLTAKNYIWTYPGKSLTKNSVMVMPEYEDPSLTNTVVVNCYAICSDYVINLNNSLYT